MKASWHHWQRLSPHCHWTLASLELHLEQWRPQVKMELCSACRQNKGSVSNHNKSPESPLSHIWAAAKTQIMADPPALDIPPRLSLGAGRNLLCYRGGVSMTHQLCFSLLITQASFFHIFCILSWKKLSTKATFFTDRCPVGRESKNHVQTLTWQETCFLNSKLQDYSSGQFNKGE